MSTENPQPATVPHKKPILAHPQDLHCVVFHVVLMLGYVLAMVLYLHPIGRLSVIETSTLARVAYVLACALMLGWCSGINVGVIVLIGLGGDRFVDDHPRDTVAVLNQMSLSAGDLIYFSDLVEEAGTPYPLIAAQQDIRALSADERAAQRAAIRTGLNLNGAKISNYDVREFVY